MKKIGLIGGMSWESTAVYYRRMNQIARQRLGGLHSALLLLHSFDFDDIAALQASGNWEGATQAMIAAAQSLQDGGAEALVICTNTMHKMAPEIETAVDLPLIHIADATAAAAQQAGHKKPLLLATRHTMEQDFYRNRFQDFSGVQTVIPTERDRATVHDIIYDQLCQGVVTDTARQAYQAIIQHAKEEGADSVIFGCTEIGLLLTQADCPLPVLDSTEIHCATAMDFALS